MYININEPEGENEKTKNVPQLISSLILGISVSSLVFGILLLAGILLGLLNLRGNIPNVALSMAAVITILVGLWLARVIYKKRTALANENSPNAQNREISLYILAALLVLVLCCLGGLALLITSG